MFFYLLSEEREELLPVELRVVLEELLRRLSELRTPEAFLLSLLAVFTLLRLGLLSLFLVLVVSIFSLLDFLPLSTLLRRVLLLRVPVLMRLLLPLLRRVVYTSSLPAGRLCELGRMFTEPKSERRLVWYDLSFEYSTNRYSADDGNDRDNSCCDSAYDNAHRNMYGNDTAAGNRNDYGWCK